MDFRDRPEDAAFRREVRGFLDAVSSTIAGETAEIQWDIAGHRGLGLSKRD